MKNLEQIAIEIAEYIINNEAQAARSNRIINEDDKCPKCHSDNIANEGPENEFTCHDCSFQWEE